MHKSDDALERMMQETAREFHRNAVTWLEGPKDPEHSAVWTGTEWVSNESEANPA